MSDTFKRFKYRRPKARPGPRVEELRSVGEALRMALEKLESAGTGEHGKLRELWRNWQMVMGEELAYLAVPLGHRKDVLVVGAEDHLAMHELTFSTPEMLERANAFMETPGKPPYFAKVEVSLMMGRTALDAPPQITSSEPVHVPPQRPPGLDGSFASRPGLDPDSPVARCYMAYLRLHGLA